MAMSKKNRITKDNVGIVYLFTNSYLDKEDTYKFGITINPFERKRIQKNSTPPTYPFYDRIIIFSTQYKEIEKWLENQFREKGFLLEGKGGGREWIKAPFGDVLALYKETLSIFSGSEMCFDGKRYKVKDGIVVECKLPRCRLDLMGILDGKKLKNTVDKKTFVVQGNGILVGGKQMPLSKYMNLYHKREGSTNEHNGFQYFVYNGILLYDMWQSLVRVK